MVVYVIIMLSSYCHHVIIIIYYHPLGAIITPPNHWYRSSQLRHPMNIYEVEFMCIKKLPVYVEGFPLQNGVSVQVSQLILFEKSADSPRYHLLHDPVYEKYHMKIRVRWLDKLHPRCQSNHGGFFAL